MKNTSLMVVRNENACWGGPQDHDGVNERYLLTEVGFLLLLEFLLSRVLHVAFAVRIEYMRMPILLKQIQHRIESSRQFEIALRSR